MSQHLEMAEECAHLSRTLEDAELQSIFARMSELHRQLHEQEEKLADWKKRNVVSASDFLSKKLRK